MGESVIAHDGGNRRAIQPLSADPLGSVANQLLMSFRLMSGLVTHGYRMLRIIPRCNVKVQAQKSRIRRIIGIILSTERSLCGCRVGARLFTRPFFQGAVRLTTL